MCALPTTVAGTGPGPSERTHRRLEATAAGYRDGENLPLGGYVAKMAVFCALITGVVGVGAAGRRRLSATVGVWDVVLLTVGTHKLSRTLSKDAVTSPLRAPFTRYTGTGGPAEVMEEVRPVAPGGTPSVS